MNNNILTSIYRRSQPVHRIVGIYHSPDLWLISLSSDWENRITIADKNLWATSVYDGWNWVYYWNCWEYYQWWNNCWFSFSGGISTLDTQTNASWYWPWNYFYSDKFRRWSWDWSYVQNDNLWWDTTDTLEARQWPCSSWYHIPSHDERTAVCELLTNTFWLGNNRFTMQTYLKLPSAWYRIGTSSDIAYQWSAWAYWSSSASTYSNGQSFNIMFDSTYMSPSYGNERTYGMPIRPFKNEPVQPDSARTELYHY